MQINSRGASPSRLSISRKTCAYDRIEGIPESIRMSGLPYARGT
jgi:hypothetical protein